MTEQDPATTETPTCYLHPGRPALLRCSRCERPICSQDAVEAPVGYQCKRCAHGGQPVRRLAQSAAEARVTKALVGVIAIVFLVGNAVPLNQQFGLVPALVGQGEWWLLLTSGFLHAGLIHVGFNGFLLYRLGEMLEPTIGNARFGALFAAGLSGGSLGVMLMTWLTVNTPIATIPLLGNALGTSPNIPTVGASGAVFGLMGAAIVGLRRRGVNPWQTDVGSLVLLNLVLTFVFPGISVGGHVGGLLAGMAAGKLLLVERQKARTATLQAVGFALGMLVLAVLLG